jgi:hypothetical protein
MSMTLRIEIFPNDLGPTVDFYTGVLDFDLVRMSQPPRPPMWPSSEVWSSWGRLPGRITAQIVIIGARHRCRAGAGGGRRGGRAGPGPKPRLAHRRRADCQTVGSARLPPPGPQRLLPAHHTALRPICRSDGSPPRSRPPLAGLAMGRVDPRRRSAADAADSTGERCCDLVAVAKLKW